MPKAALTMAPFLTIKKPQENTSQHALAWSISVLDVGFDGSRTKPTEPEQNCSGGVLTGFEVAWMSTKMATARK